ncbi:TPA: EthD family reductase [Burkholderia aenigmatica]|uniref:EthD family reductase n=1 Tax=Burkholderia sp. AU45251 TaxID=3059204 RepID=UPI00264A5FD8|nr:EthD family reductase [Burkholderia sp. AU45251]HDR9482562.1 EthD family reductase [Burkholderia aenigmatica]MDN7517722.1 EthD family reductase [Burkholderia sp. AU45251]HDR9513509.1 EthD family reductase [Burkholderia aenigmatica]HDR9590900.1 EthD family reductase [Burkholderia aenigmatica]HDR9601688.1 EthD family reductase [Burkholderia aenigmatica]
MTTLIVSYPSAEGGTFDREYYLSNHTALVRSAWGEFGLQSAEVLFPSPTPQPFACMAILRFSDQAAIDAALSSAKTAEVMGDVKNFTNITPTIFCADD